jgi:hypothetical protein
MELAEIKAIVRDNVLNGREKFAGLKSAEIGKFNRWVMWGEDDAAFPGEQEWSRVVN